MARARWIKPEFFTDARTCAVSDQAALVFAALWVEADDGGVAPGDPRDVYGRRFIKRGSWSVEQVTNAMHELSEAGLTRPFDHRGERFVLVPDFARKQGIKPKEWRHLGKDHDTITNRVLSESNAVRSAFTPKPLAVAVAVAGAVADSVVSQPADAGTIQPPKANAMSYPAEMIRKLCYPPDGQPPEGHDIGRDLQWWKVKLVKGESVERIIMALEGAPQVMTSLAGVKWSPAKVFTKGGDWASLYERAVTARGRQYGKKRAPTLIGEVMHDAQRRAAP